VHEYFRQNKPELLINIKRKANKPPEAGAAKAGKNAKTGAVAGAKTAAGAGGGGGVGSNNNNSGSKTTNIAGNGPLKATPINTNVNLNNSNNNMLAPMQAPNHNALSLSNANMLNNNNNNTMSSQNTNSHYTPLLLQDTSNINNMNLNIDDLGSEMTDGLPYYVDEDNTFNNNTNYTYNDNYMSTLPEEIATETGGLMQELHQQRTLREQFERRMESKLAALQGENNMLKSMFMESHRYVLCVMCV